MSQRKVPLERLDRLRDSERALTTQEADERRAKFGANDIVESTPLTRHVKIARIPSDLEITYCQELDRC